MRLEQRKYGGNCTLEPLYQEFCDAVGHYRVRWAEAQREVKDYFKTDAKGRKKGEKKK